MFKRTIEMNVVKKRKNDDDEVTNHPVIDVEALADIASKNVVKLIAAYFVLDAARKIAVNRLSK